MKSLREKLRQHAGFSLLEVVIASAASTVLVAGLASAIFIASETLDVESGSLATANETNRVIEQINHDLHSAVTISELTNTSVTMTVPDRDGDTVPETIRYYWSGVAGSDLDHTYNGKTEKIAEKVQSFSLAWATRLIEGTTSLPIILFVSGQYADGDGGLGTPTAAEQDRIDLMEGWGYDVTVISQEATQAEFDTELAEATVVYVSGQCNAGTLSTKLNDAAIGVVTESHAHAATLGFYVSLTAYVASQATIEIVNDTHYITQGFAQGELTVSTADLSTKWTNSTLAPDAATIADFSSVLQFPTLLILDAGDELADSSAAAGRRCQLPWGESSFDVTTLNTDGLTIMQRALEWGAGAGDDTETPEAGIVFEEFTEQIEGSNTDTITIDTPPGVANGDLLIAALVTDGEETLSPAASGWTELYMLSDDDEKMTLGVWWRLAGSSEPSNYTFDWGSSEQAYGWIMRFTGHNPANPINDDATSEGKSSSAATSAVTTTEDNCMILRIGGFDDDDINVDDAGMTDHTTITCDESGGGSSSCSGAAAYQIQSSAGSSGTADFTITKSEEYRTITIAIEPDPSP